MHNILCSHTSQLLLASKKPHNNDLKNFADIIIHNKMSTFKVKRNTKYQPTNVKTVDGTHMAFVSNFKQKHNELPDKKKQLQECEMELRELQRKDPTTYTVSDIKNRSNLKTQITQLEKSIDNTENYMDDIDYFSNVGDLVISYYAIDEREPHHIDNSRATNIDSIDSNDQLDKFSECDTEQTLQKSEGQNKSVMGIDLHDIECDMSVLDKLNQKTRKNLKSKPKTTRKRYNKTSQQYSKNNIMNYLGVDNQREKSNNNKAVILNCFLSLVDNDFVKGSFQKSTLNDCLQCGNERMLVHSEGLCVCGTCGEAEYILTDADNVGSKDPIPEKNGYPYRRINHFNELTELLITASCHKGYKMSFGEKQCKSYIIIAGR
jgi:hypothetical protein